MTIQLAHLSIAIIAFLPGLATYIAGRYIAIARAHSTVRWSLVIMVFAVFIMVIPLDQYVYACAGYNRPDGCFRIISILQYVAAFAAFLPALLRR